MTFVGKEVSEDRCMIEREYEANTLKFHDVLENFVEEGKFPRDHAIGIKILSAKPAPTDNEQISQESGIETKYFSWDGTAWARLPLASNLDESSQRGHLASLVMLASLITEFPTLTSRNDCKYEPEDLKDRDDEESVVPPQGLVHPVEPEDGRNDVNEDDQVRKGFEHLVASRNGHAEELGEALRLVSKANCKKGLEFGLVAKFNGCVIDV